MGATAGTRTELGAFGEVCPTSKQRYVYDASGMLVEREQRAPIAEPDGTLGWTVTGSTVYIGGVYEEQHDAGGAVTGTTKYYQGFGRTVAMRKDGALLYPLLDHLGSTVAMTDASGAVLSRQAYWPYGTTRSLQTYAPVTETDKLYTGQQQESGDQALGLYNYRARFYSTVLGKFVSADPRAYASPDGWNRYSYVSNSPTNYNDPSGYCGWRVWTCLSTVIDVIDKAAADFRAGASDIGHAAHQIGAAFDSAIAQGTDAIASASRRIASFATSLAGPAREAWRATYAVRAVRTIALEFALIATSGGVIHHLDPAALGDPGIVFGVRVVTGCTNALCAGLKASRGSDLVSAITIGHTIFTDLTDDELLSDPAILTAWAGLLRHELTHVGQFEDFGDAFWGVYFGAGIVTYLDACFVHGNCGPNSAKNDFFRCQLLEHQAYQHNGGPRVSCP